MRRKAIFFDRDNTLIVNDRYLGDPDRVELIPGAADAIARGRAMGFAIVVISNQSGVARGMFDEPAVRAVNSRMEELLAQQNPQAIIDHHEYCPFHPDGVIEQYRRESDLRKPRAGMIYRAREALALDLSGSWVIGDTPRDIDAGRSAGCRTIYFQHPDIKPSPDAVPKSTSRADHISDSLSDAINFIESATTAEKNTPQTMPSQSDPVSNNAGAVNRAPLQELPSNIPPRSEGGPAMKLADPSDENPSMEFLLSQILLELKRAHEPARHMDFSLARLLAGIVQVIVIAVLMIAYLDVNNASTLQPLLLLALVLQGIVIAAILAGRK